MKLSFLTACALLLAFQFCTPKPQDGASACLKGKLVKRGICGQRLIQLTSDPADGIVFARQWTDSMANKSYENVFTVANSCDFPASIQEGDEISFTLTTAPDSGCAQCRAYTPMPAEKNNIVTGCSN